MYYCERWSERLATHGDTHSGETAEEIWDALRCEEFTATQEILLSVHGEQEDSGGTDDERCASHLIQPLWLDNPLDEVRRTLTERGWMRCTQCDGAAFNDLDTPYYQTARDLEEHIAEEHDGATRVTPADAPPEAVFVAPRGGGRIDGPTLTMPTLDEIIRTGNNGLRDRVTEAMATWHTNPQIPYAIRLRIQERLLSEGFNRPIGVYEGGTYSGLSNHYILLHVMGNLQVYPSDYAPFRFVAGPERTVRSTSGMWAET